MTPEEWGISASLFVLTALLVALFVRDLAAYRTTRSTLRLAWGGGLALAAGAMAIEGLVYVGLVNDPLLQAYVFLSAAIVGVLSLGATRVFARPVVRRAYASYQAATITIVGLACFLTPPTAGMVEAGIISGNPSALLLVLSSLVTVPATVLLLIASAVALRRDRRWPTMLLISGALILGAGGALYIASFPVALYYAEFTGIVLLFFGIVSLPQPSAAPSGPTRANTPG